jgi:hypothetical protein
MDLNLEGRQHATKLGLVELRRPNSMDLNYPLIFRENKKSRRRGKLKVVMLIEGDNIYSMA